MADSRGFREVEMTDFTDEGQAFRLADNTESHVENTGNHMDSNDHTRSDENTSDKTAAVPSKSQNDLSSSKPTQPVDSDKQDPDGHGVNTPAQQRPVSSSITPSSSRHKDAVPLTSSEQLRLDKDVARITAVLTETSPEAAQRVLREKWRVFLFEGYNADHVSFIIRAGLKNSNGFVLQRVLKDDGIFKEPFQLVASRNPGIIEKVLRNATPSQLNDHVPEHVIDQMLAERIKNVPARDLVKMLAEGERLGYKPDDILDESDESVVPNVRSQPTSQEEMDFEEGGPSTNTNLAPSNRDPLLAEQERNRAALDAAKLHAGTAQRMNLTTKEVSKLGYPVELICPSCKVRLPTQSGYNYHITKKPCLENRTLDGRWNCNNCLSGFTGKQGLNYHQIRDVCKANSELVSGGPLQQQQQGGSSGLLPAIRNAQPPPTAKPQQPPRSASGAILPPRPPMYTAPPSQPSIPSSAPVDVPRSSPGGVVQRPPLHTPQMSKQDSDIKYSPADLPPETLAAMNKEIEEELERHRKKVRELSSTVNEEERNSQLVSLKNAHSNRKSMIRKKYKVSLRMRENEKRARLGAGIPHKRRPDGLRAASQSSSSAGTPAAPSSGFSPVNTPKNGSSPINGFGHPPPTSQYPRAPANAANKVFNPTHEPHLNTFIHALENAAGPSGFGVLKSQNPFHMTPTNYTHVQQTNKRRRTSTDASPLSAGQSSPHFPLPPAQPYSTGLSMMEVQAEGGASKYAKKAATKQDGNTPLQRPISSSGQNKTGAMTGTSSVAVVIKSGSGIKHSAYTIISSSDEDVAQPEVAKRGGHSTEEARSLEEQMFDTDEVRPSVEVDPVSNGGSNFKARRVGKH